jgi:DNA-binding response OmpR family regulator
MAKPTILVVEDDPGFLKNFEDFLSTMFNAEVIVKQNSNDAIEILNTKKIDILFQDIHVPGPDGFEVVKMVRASGKNVIVFIISAWNEDSYLKRSTELNASYIPKPISYSLLRSKLIEVFDKNGFEYKK